MTTLALASLQREAAHYEPHYGWGRFLGILELALTPRWPPCSPSLASRPLAGEQGVRHGSTPVNAQARRPHGAVGRIRHSSSCSEE